MARVSKNAILKGVSGAIGKQFVIKQYASGSAYPDMDNVKFSELQKLKQSVFKQAVAYAQSVVRNPVKKKEFAKKLKKGERVYNAAIKEYLAKQKGYSK